MQSRPLLTATRQRALTRLTAAALLTMTCAGCATLSGEAPLAVQIPSDCARLAHPVPYPPIRKTDLGVMAARYAAALGQANGRLEAVRVCDEKVRQSFAGNGSGQWAPAKLTQ